MVIAFHGGVLEYIVFVFKLLTTWAIRFEMHSVVGITNHIWVYVANNML